MSHTILNGLLRGFLNLICSTANPFVLAGREFCLPSAVQTVMDWIIERLQFPTSFNRPAVRVNSGCALPLWCSANLMYPSIYRRGELLCRPAISNWIFEETHTFMEVAGALAFYICRNDVHEGILKMWGWLRAYALFFQQYRPGQHTIPQIRAAQQQLY